MKPKKRILQFDEDEDSAGIRKYLIELRSHSTVCTVRTLSDLNRQIHFQQSPQLVLIISEKPVEKPLKKPVDLVKLLKRVEKQIPEANRIVVTPDIKHLPAKVVANRILEKPSNLELLDAVRLFCMRKRGPRKQFSSE